MSYLPEEAGHIVSMLEHKGEILIACQYRVYRLVKEFDVLKQQHVERLECIEFIEEPMKVTRAEIEP